MVRLITNIINHTTSLFIIMLFLTVLLSGCSSYHFGDVSKAFCYSTDKEFRAGLISTLSDKGIDVDVHYCATVGLIDALIVREGE